MALGPEVKVDQSESVEESSDDEDLEEKVATQIKAKEVEQFLEQGIVSKALHQRLEKFTGEGPSAQHVLRKNCATCKLCHLCMEDPSGRTYQEKLQIDAFKAHVCRVPATEKDPMVKYRYQVRYLKDTLAVPLHLQL